jgi:hypothetical protein
MRKFSDYSNANLPEMRRGGRGKVYRAEAEEDDG